MTILERDAIVSGIGMSPIGRRTGRTALAMTEAASRAAIVDAGLSVGDIDGIATMGETPLADAAAALAIEARWTGGGWGRGGLLTPVMDAISAVATGQARHVLVYRTVQMMGGSIVPMSAGGDGRGPGATEEAAEAMPDWIGPMLTMHAYSAANWVAMLCRRHMHLYGTTKEQLGALAVHTRAMAGLNPDAVYREPMTLDDYLGARLISDPLGLYDCDVPVDGSVAVVISNRSHAVDCPATPVRFHAVGGTDGEGDWDQRADYPKMESVDAAAEMWGRSELGPGDVDVAQLYDGFTFLALAWLEALGFCGDGESGPFVEGGTRIALDGQLPLNTYGGQLSAGRLHGYWLLHEAVVQLRHAAGDRQVPGAEVAVVGAGGGPIAGCLLLTR